MAHPFPDLPPGVWSLDIRQAHDRLSNGYRDICAALAQEDTDPVRMRLLDHRLNADYIPILRIMEQDGRVGDQWVVQAGILLAGLIPQLDQACAAAQESEDQNIERTEYVQHVHSGRRGRPRKRIRDVLLLDWFTSDRQLSARSLAKDLGVDRRTLKKEMDRLGIQRKFHDISDAELDDIFREIKRERPEEGLYYFMGVMRKAGLRVQQERLRQSIQRVSPLQQALRQPVAAPRVYSVTRPNKVWHCDGHHKLIRWGFVVHGIVDGYSRMITGMRVNTNNRAETVLEVFLKATSDYGKPSRMRGDRGGENIEIAVWMIMNQGANRGSFLWGSSTRNTRIERLWVEVGTKFARRWRAFFERLERLHFLDPGDRHHLWLLHFLFLEELQGDCQEFVEVYNKKPLRQKRKSQRDHERGNTLNKSPAARFYLLPHCADLFLRGQVQEGVYAEDEHQGVDPILLQRYYSVDRPYTFDDPDSSGAGHSDNEGSDAGEQWVDDLADEEAMADDDYDLSELELMIAHDQQHNIRHDAIETPDEENPFADGDFDVFRDTLQAALDDGHVPENYNFDLDVYPDEETILVAQKPRVIELDLGIWLPRAVRWALGLQIMTQLLSNDE